ncbi:unnamed protein product [Boreogadus saida]
MENQSAREPPPPEGGAPTASVSGRGLTASISSVSRTAAVRTRPGEGASGGRETPPGCGSTDPEQLDQLAVDTFHRSSRRPSIGPPLTIHNAAARTLETLTGSTGHTKRHTE